MKKLTKSQLTKSILKNFCSKLQEDPFYPCLFCKFIPEVDGYHAKNCLLGEYYKRFYLKEKKQ